MLGHLWKGVLAIHPAVSTLQAMADMHALAAAAPVGKKRQRACAAKGSIQEACRQFQQMIGAPRVQAILAKKLSLPYMVHIGAHTTHTDTNTQSHKHTHTRTHTHSLPL